MPLSSLPPRSSRRPRPRPPPRCPPRPPPPPRCPPRPPPPPRRHRFARRLPEQPARSELRLRASPPRLDCRQRFGGFAMLLVFFGHSSSKLLSCQRRMSRAAALGTAATIRQNFNPLSRRVGECFHAAVILATTAIERHRRDSRRPWRARRSPCRLPSRRRCFRRSSIRRAHPPPCSRRRQRLAGIVVDELRVNVLVAAENAEPRTLGRARTAT